MEMTGFITEKELTMSGHCKMSLEDRGILEKISDDLDVTELAYIFDRSEIDMLYILLHRATRDVLK